MKCTACDQEVATDQLGSLLPHSRNPALSSAAYDPCPGTLDKTVAVPMPKKRSRRKKGGENPVPVKRPIATGSSAAPGGPAEPGQPNELAAQEAPMTEVPGNYTAEPVTPPAKKPRKARGMDAWSGFLVAEELSDPLHTFAAAQEAAALALWAGNASGPTVLNIYQVRLIAQVKRGIKEQRFGRVRKAKQRRPT